MKRMKDVLAADILRVTATITKSLKAAFLICGIVLLGCQNEFIVATTAVEEVMPTDVVVDSLVQPSETVQLDVLVVLDTSGSMSDNYEQVSRGVEILSAAERGWSSPRASRTNSAVKA